jgi:membrane fusion protein (multidrug efflux system)
MLRPVHRGVTFTALGLAVVAATAAALVLKRPQAQSAPPPAASASAGGRPQEGPVVADAVKLASREVALTASAVGTLVANESVDIAAELSRRVVKVYATDGARVKKGDLLFKLDDADLGAQLAELNVRKKLAQDVEARQKKLRAEGLASQQDYERARTDLELIDAQAASLGVTLARTAIRAPFDGRLGLRNVSEGAMVSPQTTLVTLHDDAKLKLDFALPERYAPLVQVDQVFGFRVQGHEEAFEAKVVAIEPQIQEQTRSVRIRGLLDNPGAKLKPGSFANVEFPLRRDAGGLLVPAVAVIPSLGGHGVYRFKDGKAELVEVEIGVRTESEVQLVKGVSEGDVVLTSNLLRLRPGAAVTLGKVTGDTVAE